jgi:hypothetical protein
MWKGEVPVTDDRIAKLSQRFTRHAVSQKQTANRTRERRSFYLDAELTERLDRIYRDLNHGLYPQSISKSVFLETVMEFGLDHLDDIKPMLAASAVSRDAS